MSSEADSGRLEELAALRDGCAVWVDSAATLVEMRGEDRHRFLNGLITADVLDLAPGSARYGLFTSLKGRILADVLVIVLPERIWLRLPPGSGASIVEHMSRYIITDVVELRELDEPAPVMLGGRRAADDLDGWLEQGTAPEAPGELAEARLAGRSVWIVREPRGPAAYSIWLSAGRAEELMAALVGRPGAPVPVRGTTVESARVEAGIPRFGVDFDEQTFPQEAGLDSVVSYEKGCYLGQEIVARIHFRGGVNRVLRSLEFDRGTEVSPGDKLVSGDETIGEITSVAGPGSNRALGSVTVSAAECDGTLTLEGGAAVRLVALPFRTG